VQIRTVKESNSTVSNNYEENSLRAEVLKYKEKYDNKYKELEKAEKELEKQRQNATQNNSDLESKEEEIKQGNKILGLSEVTGPGVIVTLSDSKKDISSALDPSSLVVHDLDVLSVINELQNAGAEAISINDQRIVPTTGIPSIQESLLRSIFIFFFLASSSKFTHKITLLVISSIWKTRFKFRSKHVESTTTIVASGFPKHI